MPEMDKPEGFGTGSYGKGMGPCCKGSAPHRGSAWGSGRGFWQGRQSGRCLCQELSPEDEKGFLEQQKSWLTTRLAEIDKRLANLNQSEA